MKAAWGRGGRRIRPLGWWLALALTTGLGAVVARGLGLPGPSLFAALVVGIGWALVVPGRVTLPSASVLAGQAVTGVALGSYLQLSTLAAVAANWPAVVGVTLATLGLSLLAGLALARIGDVDRATASLGMIAGGATGIVAMSRDLGADDRLVAVMQYLRVVIVVLLAPVLVRVAFAPVHDGPGSTLGSMDASLAIDGLFTLVAAFVGALAARAVGWTAGSLLGPLLVAAVLTVTGVSGGAQVPDALRDVAFAVIGLQVGLRFTPATLRRAGRLLPGVLAAVAGMIIACGLLAAGLAAVADISLMDAYLATTPGGLYAVLATALGSGANTTFVLAVQALRLLVMVLAAPPLVRRLVGAPARPEPAQA